MKSKRKRKKSCQTIRAITLKLDELAKWRVFTTLTGTHCLVELSVVINVSLYIIIAAVSPYYPAGFVYLETRLLHGEISYRKWHIVKRKDQWMPSETHLSDLRAKQFTEPSSVRFFATGNGGISSLVLPTTWWRRCIDCFRMCSSCGCI